MSVFACMECNSSAFVIGGELTDQACVRCDNCGARLGFWAEFRGHLERRLTGKARFPEAGLPKTARRRRLPERLA